MFYKILVALEVVGVALAHHWATVHDPLLLCAGNFVGITSFLKFSTCGHMLRASGSSLVGIESGSTANTAHSAAIAKCNTHSVISHARQQPNGTHDRFVADGQLVSLLVKPARL